MAAVSTSKDPRSLRLAIGLGNPGARYRGTRHNVGFEVVEAAARTLGASWSRQSEGGLFRSKTRWRWAFRDDEFGGLGLVEPLTFMNLSGQALTSLARKATIELDPSQCLVVVDDLALPPGHLRIRGQGSDGGHNGLRSIISCLGSHGFPRLRVGIGSPSAAPEAPRSTADYVLKVPDSPEERDLLSRAVARAAEAIIVWGSRASLEDLMNRFNGRVDISSVP